MNRKPIPLTSLLDDALYYKAREPQEKKYPLRPSASGYCQKRLYFDLLEYAGKETFDKEHPEPNVMRLLTFGHHVEASALENFESVTGLKVKYKQQAVTLFKLNDGRLIEGSIDAVFEYEGQKILVDVKSVKNAWSSHFRSRWDETIYKYTQNPHAEQIESTEWYIADTTKFVDSLGDDFLTDNFYQINAYMFSQWAIDHGITRAAIYRYCKNDSNHMVLQFEKSEELFERVRAKFQRVADAVAKDTPKAVKCDYIPGSIRCAFCPYKNQCHDGDMMKEWLGKEYGQKVFPTPLKKAPPELSELLPAYDDLTVAEAERAKLQTKIIKLMIDNEIRKIRLDNEHVYELKYLKDRIDLRRGKI